MKKILFILAISIFFINAFAVESMANQPQPIVSVEVPTESITSKSNTVAEQSKTSKAIEATKEATDKSVKATKDFTNKAVKATKKGYKKTVKATKDFTGKTVENTKDALENMNPNKPVTLEDLEDKARIKTLKNEKKELRAAYNSRIKDINAKVKATSKATNISDVQKQNKIYTLNKEKADLILQRDAAMEKYS